MTAPILIKAHAPETAGASPQPSVRKAHARSRIGALAIAVLCSAFLLLAAALAPSAHASPVSVVPDDSFAPEHYSWYFDFETVAPLSGFQYVADLAPYYSRINHSDPSQGRYDCVKKGDYGYAAFIGRDTRPTDASGNPRFRLRFSQGTYEGTPVDAVLTLKSWTYIEPANGWDDYWLRNPSEPSYIEKFAPGVYYNPCYTNDSSKKDLSEQPSLSNINLYVNGISDLTVEIAFYESGTTNPVAVSGHATCIDLDVRQAVTFESGVSMAEIAQSSTAPSPAGDPYLSIEEQTGRIRSSSYAIAANDSDDAYQCGLAGAYFDTTQSTPFSLTFESSWVGETNPDGSPGFSVSFFALTPEYVANPSVSDIIGIEKRIAQDKPAAPGDTVPFSIDLTMPIEGKTCRVGYRYRSLEVNDTMHEKLDPLVQTCSLTCEGVTVPNAVSVKYDKATRTLTITFRESFLAETRMLGQTYSITFDARVAGYPSVDGEVGYEIPNKARVTVNGSASLDSNTVFARLARGRLALEKVDGNDSSKTLSGAVFSLYREEDGACVAHDIQTDEGGWAYVEDLPFGRYRLEETKAPEGYVRSETPVAIDITEEHIEEAATYCLDNYPDVRSVVITKTIPAASLYFGHGRPTFLFLLSGNDATGAPRSYCVPLQFEEGKGADENGTVSAACTIENVPVGTYAVRELPSLRYELSEISTNGRVEGNAAILNLAELDEGRAAFANAKTSGYGGSDTALAVNRFVKQKEGS